ncbi:flagellar biosynthesis anti-sigma factor FlgM [Desulfatibacillum aliphaticivorans]|uniref:Negative regulator of flagellin synthesis n=1 Tax=Desulfatibacillum aliphaticivorans TaxID=218208 RepID=B8FJQ1_DESAL|nr:flagellar biosynthesis anti-sigma factor FlgM [Desulfatibacillum aliphaticivorans]ACL02329.1 Anti-sigma-28 factor FlgM family protein [Desulfatibacillum aliphaticivorans]
MKVTSNNYEISKYLNETATRESQKAAETDAKSNQTQAAGATGQDVVVELSQTSQEVQMAREVIEQQPDMREEKVAALKAQMESGSYEVNPEKIAEKMLRMFMDETG